MNEVVPMLVELKTRMSTEVIARFDWEATEQEQVRLDEQMEVFLRFRADVRAWERCHTTQKWLSKQWKMKKNKRNSRFYGCPSCMERLGTCLSMSERRT